MANYPTQPRDDFAIFRKYDEEMAKSLFESNRRQVFGPPHGESGVLRQRGPSQTNCIHNPTETIRHRDNARAGVFQRILSQKPIRLQASNTDRGFRISKASGFHRQSVQQTDRRRQNETLHAI